jgi:hypothetical protein
MSFGPLLTIYISSTSIQLVPEPQIVVNMKGRHLTWVKRQLYESELLIHLLRAPF